MTNSGKLKVVGRYAYISQTASNKVAIYDVSNPYSPYLAGEIQVSSTVQQVGISGNKIIVFYGTNASNATLAVYKLPYIEAPSLQAGSIKTSYLQITGDSVTDKNIFAGGALLGIGGLHSGGRLAVYATGTPSFVSSLLGGLYVGTSSPATTSPQFGVFSQSTALIEATSSGSVPLTIRGAGTQTANYLQIQDATNLNTFVVNSGGGFISSASSTVAGISYFDLLANLTGGLISSASSTVASNLTVTGGLNASSTLTVGSFASFYNGFIFSASFPIAGGV